jgi:hypothetical protein
MIDLDDYKTEADLVQAIEARKALKAEIRDKGQLFLSEIEAEVEELYTALRDAQVFDIESAGISDKYYEDHADDIIERLKAYVATVYIEPFEDKNAEEYTDEALEAFEKFEDYIDGVRSLKEAYLAIMEINGELDHIETKIGIS